MRKNKELERRRTDGEGGSIPCPKLPPKTEGPGKQRDKREEKGVVAFTCVVQVSLQLYRVLCQVCFLECTYVLSQRYRLECLNSQVRMSHDCVCGGEKRDSRMLQAPAGLSA